VKLFKKKHNPFMWALLLLGLQGCANPPHVQDWQRDRITEVPSGEIEVAICFNKNTHSKAEVLELARTECKARIVEVQNLVAHDKLQQVQYLNEAEGNLFSGPLARKRQLNAMLDSLQLEYVEHDSFACPVTTRHRVVVNCLYNPDATDSMPVQEKTKKLPQMPELPPELPADLKP